jgi:uncharacterized membrane protein YdfJ with MMPL/SSD domain
VQADEHDKRFVACGIVTSTRFIGCAEPIMVVVFAGLQLNGTPTVENFGVSCAVAVILDTAALRRLLVPVSMMLLERVYCHRAHVLEPGSVA